MHCDHSHSEQLTFSQEPAQFSPVRMSTKESPMASLRSTTWSQSFVPLMWADDITDLEQMVRAGLYQKPIWLCCMWTRVEILSV